ncbi:MAG: class II fructose-bisphosphate aldolase [Omnitrophica WOR_2 bacterium]
MSVQSIPELLSAALAGGYAAGYFESWNLESLQGVIDAAEETHSPVIIGFNGNFLSGEARLTRERISWYGALGLAAAESAKVPCGFIFNECPIDARVRQAVTSGFNLIMLADPEASLDDYTQRVAGLVSYAHSHSVAVEAEIGELPSGTTGEVLALHAARTDPEMAARFVAQTGIDLLSVSIGNVHALVAGDQDLDLDLLARIHERVRIPLGLHGGTGIRLESLREAIHLGVGKVAYGTYLKQRYLAALRKALGSDEINPHKLLGIGGHEDILVAGRLAVREAILERIEFLGCCGRA